MNVLTVKDKPFCSPLHSPLVLALMSIFDISLLVAIVSNNPETSLLFG